MMHRFLEAFIPFKLRGTRLYTRFDKAMEASTNLQYAELVPGIYPNLFPDVPLFAIWIMV
jgi:hypothetical protein